MVAEQGEKSIHFKWVPGDSPGSPGIDLIIERGAVCPIIVPFVKGGIRGRLPGEYGVGSFRVVDVTQQHEVKRLITFGPIRALDMPNSPEVRDMSIEVEVSSAFKLGLGYLVILIMLVRHIKVIRVIQFDFDRSFPLRGKDEFG